MYLAPKYLLRTLFWRLVGEARPQNKGSTFLSEFFLRDSEYRSGPGPQTNDLPQCSRSTDWASTVWGHFSCWQRRWLVNLLKGFILSLYRGISYGKICTFYSPNDFPQKSRGRKWTQEYSWPANKSEENVRYNVSEYRSKVRKKQERKISVLYTDSNTGTTL